MYELNKFDDLTIYSHQISPYFLAGVKNVGWLDISSKFREGGVPEGILNKLRNIIGGLAKFHPLVEPIRESPICQFCGIFELNDAKGRSLPRAEFWVPAGEVIYAAPIEIIHYIEIHNYKPPEEYVEAIYNLDVEIDFNAEFIYEEKLKRSGWFDRVR